MRAGDQATEESRTISRRSRTRGGNSWRRRDFSSSRVASSSWMRIIHHYTAVPLSRQTMARCLEQSRVACNVQLAAELLRDMSPALDVGSQRVWPRRRCSRLAVVQADLRVLVIINADDPASPQQAQGRPLDVRAPRGFEAYAALLSESAMRPTTRKKRAREINLIKQDGVLRLQSGHLPRSWSPFSSVR